MFVWRNQPAGRIKYGDYAFFAWLNAKKWLQSLSPERSAAW